LIAPDRLLLLHHVGCDQLSSLTSHKNIDKHADMKKKSIIIYWEEKQEKMGGKLSRHSAPS
jgi:hypothetical protein